MSVVRITHCERRTTKCVIVRDISKEGPILAWITPGQEQELEVNADMELVLSFQEMGLPDAIDSNVTIEQIENTQIDCDKLAQENINENSHEKDDADLNIKFDV